MMTKRVISMLLISILLMMQVAVFAEPSDWAVEFIENATTDNLVPEPLRSDYQNNIKRYEYVLMALKVLEQNDVEVEIKNAEPFVDISEHPYKNEIIKAFNAGIVGGYEDNTFRPEREISRQEVSALVYNLVKSINDATVLPDLRSDFSDSDKISSWAKPYVEFNYVKSIISGIGKVDGLDTMDPLGQTTREQSITLLYKVSKDKELLATVEFEPIVDGGSKWESKELNLLAAKVGYDSLMKAQVIADRDDVIISDVSERSFSLLYTDGSRIEMSNIYDHIYLSATYNTLDDGDMINDYVVLFEAYFEDEQFEKIFNDAIVKLSEDASSGLNEKLGSGGQLQMYSETVVDGTVYSILYKK